MVTCRLPNRNQRKLVHKIRRFTSPDQLQLQPSQHFRSFGWRRRFRGTYSKFPPRTQLKMLFSVHPWTLAFGRCQQLHLLHHLITVATSNVPRLSFDQRFADEFEYDQEKFGSVRFLGRVAIFYRLEGTETNGQQRGNFFVFFFNRLKHLFSSSFPESFTFYLIWQNLN